MEIAERFGDNLVRQRHVAKLSQEELASRAEIHRTAITQLEKGERLPRIDTLVKLAAALSTPPERLLEGIGWEPTVTKTGSWKVSKPKK